MTTDETNTVPKNTDVTEPNNTDTTEPKSTDTTESKNTDTPEQPAQRSVQDLLKLDTFQGMTDQEIQSLIDYYVELAHTDEQTKAYQAAAITSMNENTERWNKAADESNDLLKQMLSVDLNLGKIGADGFPEGSESK